MVQGLMQSLMPKHPKKPVERVRQPPNNHEEGQLKTSGSPVFLSCIQDHISSQVSSEKQVLKLPA
jgi:hypothetical protein